MVEDGEEDEESSHDQHAACPMQLRLEVEDETIPGYLHEGGRRIPDAEVLLLCLCVEEMADQDERDQRRCSRETIDKSPSDEDCLMVLRTEMCQTHDRVAAHLQEACDCKG